MLNDTRSWVLATILILLSSGPLVSASARAEVMSADAALKSRFELLSQHGNVECSVKFENSIATMPADAKLQGSCCAPMDEARYRKQF